MIAAQYIVLLCWVVFLAYWFVSARSVKPTQEVRYGIWRFRWIGIGVAVAFVLLKGFGGPPFHSPLSISHIPPSAAITTISVVLVIAGLVIAIVARRRLAGNWSSAVVLKRDQELITTGLYEYMRYPIYTGVLLMAFGSAVLAGTPIPFILFFALLFFFWYKLKGEEELLTEHVPREYPVYKRRVKALIPYIF